MSKFHEITIRSKDKSANLQTGANTEILIDGEPLKGVTSATLEVSAGNVARLKVEMIGTFAVDLIGNLEQRVYEPIPMGAKRL